MGANWSSFIDYNITEGSGLKIGDILVQKSPEFNLKSKVVGFDKSGCPFVEYTEIWYAPGASPNEGRGKGDAYQVGDVLPFPWSDPAQYKCVTCNS